MKHGVKKRKLGRKKGQREALLQSLASSLIKHEKIETTEAKAKEVRPFIEKLITRAKNDTVANRRMILSRLGNRNTPTKKIFEIGKKYKDRSGGYTRITKLASAPGSSTTRAIIELV